MTEQFIAVVPAAGVGARMGAAIPKQYLPLQDKTVIEHTLTALLTHPRISQVVVALGPEDGWFNDLMVANDPAIMRVDGG